MGTSKPDELAEVEKEQKELSGLKDTLAKLDMESRAGVAPTGPLAERRAQVQKDIERRTKRLEDLKAAVSPPSRKTDAST